MIVPSIDLMNGQAVQLVGGREKALDAGDPLPIAERFRVAGEIAVIDLDAALGQGSNEDAVRRLCRVARCRVGGGIRTVERARQWLDWGAEKVILGTAATVDNLKQLPRERVIAALDAYEDEVVVEGWRTKTGRTIAEGLAELAPHVGGFLVTFVEKEGRLGGTSLNKVPKIVEAAGHARVTIAGGITVAEEIAVLDRAKADAQVGMALYTNRLHLGDAIAAPLRSDRADGLFPTVVTDEYGSALGLVYSNAESIREAVDTMRGVYFSRSRNGLWRKGESSGAHQELLGIDLDCDRDALRFRVRQHGAGFCHRETYTCWGRHLGLVGLERVLRSRLEDAPEGSYTRRLFNDPDLLASKIREEARELTEAEGEDALRHEAADLLYFALVRLVKAGIPLAEVEAELERRGRRVSRRPGNAKPERVDG
ncbi:MAG: phosphoribosyl-ATP diphosphatase [Candidatus Sumerlaeia bacterium]|nr:phosphoribosyl-ATP diphosphatase [Candidatus Sumerlaeia bacterium]